MRATTAVLTVLLIAGTTASGVLLYKQRESIVSISSKSAELERALVQRSTDLHDRDQKIDALEKTRIKLEAERTLQSKQLAELAELQKERDAARARADQLT